MISVLKMAGRVQARLSRNQKSLRRLSDALAAARRANVRLRVRLGVSRDAERAAQNELRGFKKRQLGLPL